MCIPGGMIEPWLTYKEEDQNKEYEDRVCNYSGLLSVEQYQIISEREERLEEEYRYGSSNK